MSDLSYLPPVTTTRPQTVASPDLDSGDPLLDMADLFGNSMMIDQMCSEVDGQDLCEDPQSEQQLDDPLMSVEPPAPELEPQVCEPPTPEEKIAAAEVSRDALEARMQNMRGLPETERAVIMERTRGLSGEALVREMEMIDRALAGPNGDRALHTLAGLQTMLSEDASASERLTPDIIEMMVDGVAERRSDSDRGQEGVMGASHARASARALLEMDDEQYASAVRMLNQAGLDADGNEVAGADRGAEQALILKAIGARHDQIETNIFQKIWSFFGGETEADRAMQDIQGFADEIRGMDRFELIRQTTLLDVHDENTSTFDPMNPTRHLDQDPTNEDTQGDNDALYQRYTDSCAPTSSQIVRGEVDPIFALSVHKQGTDPSNGTDTARQQHDVLEGHGGTAVSRFGQQARTDLTGALDTMQAAGTLDSTQRQAVQRLTTGATLTPEQRQESEAALEAVRAANGGRPTDAELEAMRSNQGKRGAGMVTAEALDEVVTGPTGVEFDYHDTESGGVTAADLDSMEATLMDGQEVPFRVKWASGGHAMMIADCRRDSNGNRSFLMSEPVTGSTRWVSEADLVSGAFTNTTFNIGSGTMRGYFTGNQD